MRKFKIRECSLLFFLLMFIFCAFSCSVQSTVSSEKDAVNEIADELIKITVEKAKSDNYISLLSSHPAIKNTIEKFAAGNYDMPQIIYQIDLTDEMIIEYMENNMLDYSLDSLSIILRQETINKFILGIPALIEGKTGPENLAASSMLETQKVGIDKRIKHNAMLILTFKEGMPIAVVFLKGKGGAFLALSQPLIGFEPGNFNDPTLNDLLSITPPSFPTNEISSSRNTK